MRSSHGSGAVDEAVAKVGANKADISGMAAGLPSDEINDRQGRPREGQRSPAGPRPHFVRLSVAGVEEGRVLGSPLYTADEGYVPPADFDPIVADQSTVVFGWLPDLKGEWHLAVDVRRLVVNGGRVEAHFSGGTWSTVANFGADVDEARRYRARVAHYLAEVHLRVAGAPEHV